MILWPIRRVRIAGDAGAAVASAARRGGMVEAARGRLGREALHRDVSGIQIPRS